ncbi:hypothetical protein E2C01_065943 [Portunus trituberculatus]|uniref:Uncharacterized protein n=1 Tax=Portunus trituberculatus TaxID=210409 RepID=A0A5B7HSJ9_PORTR|nr:hypothetical protein [Portunus trituberculatus]
MVKVTCFHLAFPRPHHLHVTNVWHFDKRTSSRRQGEAAPQQLQPSFPSAYSLPMQWAAVLLPPRPRLNPLLQVPGSEGERERSH